MLTHLYDLLCKCASIKQYTKYIEIYYTYYKSVPQSSPSNTKFNQIKITQTLKYYSSNIFFFFDRNLYNQSIGKFIC